MQFFRKILLFLTCWFVAAISVAQQIKSVSAPVSYRAINWTVQDGLSAYGMHAMIKDSKGFLWFGSTSIGGELCRFDGATFKKYIPDPQKSVSYFSPALITQRNYNTIQQRDNFETVATRQN
jgi:hypothetical protein